MNSFLSLLIYVSIFVGFFAISFYILTFFSALKKKIPQLEDSELPFVTVIIPAWNEESSVENTLNSILNSDYPNFEVIFVDDGSKDNTLNLARNFESNNVRVFTKPNGGKASALNFGIKHAKGEIIFSMDADTRVEKESMKKMVRYFADPNVVSVTPAMLIDNPNTILRRVQSIEYFLGIFLRKVFASLNAIYIAPGAFTGYRKTFFEQHGGYAENNITEDLELALRIQSKGYKTENCPTAKIYTLGPPDFKSLSKQRVRWYYGLIKNFWNYRWMMSKNFGDLGIFVLPIGWATTFFCMIITVSIFIEALPNFIHQVSFLNKINFSIGMFDFSIPHLKLFLFEFLSTPLVLFSFISLGVILSTLKYAEYKSGNIKHLFWNKLIFFFLFGPLFCYWWIVAFIKLFANINVKWR